MVSGTVGSPTNTGWKRRSSAASFSTCLRYSSSVVAPMQCSSPRASAGLSMLPASIEPSALPAPTIVCSSSMNRMMLPCCLARSFSTALRRSSLLPAARVLERFLGHRRARAGGAQRVAEVGLVLARGEHEQLARDVRILALLRERVGEVQQARKLGADRHFTAGLAERGQPV